MSLVLKQPRAAFVNKVLPIGQRAIDLDTGNEYAGDGVTTGGLLVESDTIYATAAEIAATTYPKGQRVYDLTNNVVIFGDGTVGGSSGITKMTTAEREAVTPAAGVLVYDTDLGTYWGGDGSTAGGTSLASGGGGGGVQSVKAAYVSNVADLGSPGNADGVSISDGDEVLLIAQTDASENGIYVNNSGTLERHTDYDNDADFQNKSVLVFIREGDTLADQLYHTDGASDFELGTDDMVWEDYRDLSIGDVAGLQTALDGKSDTGHAHVVGDVTGLQTALDGKSDTGHTHDVEDLTNKPSFVDVDVVFTTNLSNLASPPTGIDGVTFVEGMRVFLGHQSDKSENGFYIFTSGQMVRDTRFDASGDFQGRSFLVSVGLGTSGGGRLYRFTCAPTFTLDTDNISAVQLIDWLPDISNIQKGVARAADLNEITATALLLSNDSRVPILCMAATTANVDISANALASYDGYSPVALDLILVKDQTDASENGVYVWNSGQPMSRIVGLSNSAGWSGKRRVVFVLRGDSQTGFFTADEPAGFVLGTDDLDFYRATIALGTAAALDVGTSANNVVQLSGDGVLPALSAENLTGFEGPVLTTVNETVRGTDHPHLGAFANQPFKAIDNLDNSAYVWVRNGVMWITTSSGNFQVPAGLAVQKDDGEMDIEVVLADGSRVSVGSLDSDEVDAYGNAFRPGFQQPNIGCFATEQYIQGRSF